MKKFNLQSKLALIQEHWQPKVVGELNGQQVRLAKFQGEFVWHAHADEDEFFLVLAGSFEMQFRDRVEILKEGDCIIVPRGTEHCPRAEDEVHVLLFEPKGTVNTGGTVGDRTVPDPEKI